MFVILCGTILAAPMYGQGPALFAPPASDPPLKSQFVKQRLPRPFAATATSLPLKMSYQGLLTTTGGTPVADGLYDLTVDLYDSLTNGSSKWSEIHTGVPVQRGTFSITLGVATPLSLQFNQPLFAKIVATNGPAGPSYPLTFSPRSELSSAPYSLGPWVTKGTDLYYKNGSIGIGSTAPESSGIATVKMDIADEDGTNSDISQRVAGLGWGEYHFAKSRGTLASPTTLLNGDLIGGMNYFGHEGTNFQAGAGIYGFVDSIPAAGQMPTRMSFYTWNLTSGWGERMRLDHNGLLSFGSGSGEAISSKRTAGGNLYGLDFYTSFQPRMSISNSGNVGIGTTTPSYGLELRNDSPNYAAFISNLNTGTASGLYVQANGAAGTSSSKLAVLGYAWYGTNSNYGGYFYGFGGTSSYGVYALAGGATNNYGGYFAGDLAYTGALINASDAKFKENISDYSGALSSIMRVKPRVFTFKSGAGYNRFSFSPGRHYGFVAQELEQVLPELVVDAAQPAEMDSKGIAKGEPMVYKGVKTMEMIPILVQAIQEQQKLIEELQKRIARLEK
jgi:hypothetical protein